MSEPVAVRPSSDLPRRLFAMCLVIALLLHFTTIFLLRDETFFGMAVIREQAHRLFRVPVAQVARPRPRTHPMQLPERADVIAAVEQAVAAAVAEVVAPLPAASLREPPPGARLEEHAHAREVEPAPLRVPAPAHLEAVEATAAQVGHGAIREQVVVVARRADPAGGAGRISAATARALRSTGPAGSAAMPAYSGPRPQRPRPPAPPRPAVARRPRDLGPPPEELHPNVDARRILDPLTDARAEDWDEFFDLELTVYRPQRDQPGYFRLDVVPKTGSHLPVAARDVLFVLDASKSMGQHRFGQAQRVIAEAIAALPDIDRFTVLTFQARATWWRATLQDSTPLNRRAAVAWVNELRAEGRTDLYRSLSPTLASIRGGSRPVLVLLCSDGRPTAGERDSRVLINELTGELGGRASIFAYGAGSNVNRYLLDLLTYRNRGAARFGLQPSDMGPGLTALERSIREPVYLRPEIILGNVEAGSVFPRALPDIYVGHATRVWGRLAPGATHMGVRLLGWSQGGRREILREVRVPAQDTGTPAVAREWAQQKLLFLVGEITAFGHDPARGAEVAALARSYALPEAYLEAARGR